MVQVNSAAQRRQKNENYPRGSRVGCTRQWPLPNRRVVNPDEIHCVRAGVQLVRDLPGGSYSHLLRRPGGVPQQADGAQTRMPTQSQIQIKQFPPTLVPSYTSSQSVTIRQHSRLA